MEGDDDFAAFVAISIVPGKITRVTVPAGVVVHINNAAVDIEADSQITGRVNVFAKTSKGNEILLFPFIIGKFECTAADLLFNENDVIEFSVKGPVGASLTGTLVGGFRVDIEQI